MTTEATLEAGRTASWRPLSSTQRRVLGVLIEKAKTTPDAYPMSLNALTAGCNQKSNRDPQLNLSTEQVERALDELREMRVVAEVQGDGRVPRYRHYAYEWLGVDKIELSIMAELLLRGPQTIGELRGRASRMDPIESVQQLVPILDALIAKQLVISLTPAGRGQVVTHGLFKERELDEQRRQYAGGGHVAVDDERNEREVRPAPVSPDVLAELHVEVAELRAAVMRLQQEVRELREAIS